MRVTSIQVHRLQLPLLHLWVTAYGCEEEVETLIVRLEDESGAFAWGESCPLASPLYLPETAATAATMIRSYLGNVILGREFDSPMAVSRHLAQIRGNSFAKAALEIPFWGIEAKRKSLPLHKLLGASSVAPYSGCGLGIMQVRQLLERIERTVDAGCPRVKLKIRPGHDLDVLRQVRDAFPSLRLQVDCNGAYTLEDTPLFVTMDELGLDLIEQPLHYRDLADHATLQEQLRTPISLDESITEPADVEHAIRLQACKAITLKPGRVGGIGPSLQILEQCREAGINCWIGGMLESDLGTALNAELAACCGDAYVHDLPPTGTHHSVQLTDRPITASSGRIELSSDSYLGRTVNEEAVQQFTVESFSMQL